MLLLLLLSVLLFRIPSVVTALGGFPHDKNSDILQLHYSILNYHLSLLLLFPCFLLTERNTVDLDIYVSIGNLGNAYSLQRSHSRKKMSKYLEFPSGSMSNPKNWQHFPTSRLTTRHSPVTSHQCNSRGAFKYMSVQHFFS